MNPVIEKLIKHVEGEVTSIDLRKTELSQTCIDSALLLFETQSKADPLLQQLTNRIHERLKECRALFNQAPTPILQHNYNSLQLIALSLEMSFLL